MRKSSYYLWFFALCLLILYGCGKLERKGTPTSNTPPTVFFTNVPPESTSFSVNPRMYWFGIDVDGFITAYQYAVMVTDSVVGAGGVEEVKNLLHSIPPDSVSWVDQLSLKNMIGAHVQAEPGGHARNVKTYADMDPEIYTPQYIFLRAIDNRGAISEVKNKLFYRNNHRPEAFIDVDEDFASQNHYCLEETTLTWKGIAISWSGQDTADYPDERDQPEFDFKWELVGPFDSPSAVDTGVVVDSSLDSILIVGQWVYTRWVSQRRHVFKGLENYADSGYGWYQLRVRVRDDAFVSHETPATLDFRILKPKFRYADKNRKTILVVDATAYGKATGIADNGSPVDTGDVRPFYRDALSQPGLYDELKFWYDPYSAPAEDKKSPPGEDVLSRYDLTIVLNLGSKPAITEQSYKRYKEYLNVGGRLWLIGLNNFRLSSGRAEPHSVQGELRGPAPNTYEVASEYCGIEEVFVPTYTFVDTMTLEFVGAEPFGLWEDLPVLEADPAKCGELKGYDPTNVAYYFGVRGIPYVCYDAMSNKLDFARRIPYQRRIYSFISYYGSISPMHQKPCAINYIGSTNRTAEFCFPLNLMKNESPDYPVFDVMKKMVEWFWEDLP
ncbi:MAG: hypothetical protein AMJ91_06225 [candidate division Zixibacteria bacterium SM23_73_3]|nr:MAG: hypothetical protein AMJ91_06225 [candidate division Zixibacteria bacterium SM23_73_3]